MGVIVMKRILRDGDTYKCFVVKNKAIEDIIRTAMSRLKPFGACNVQLRLKDNEPYIFEINARCSGTTAARALCGFNEPKMIADYLCFNQELVYNIKEQAVLRYWKELVVENELVNKLEEKGSLSRDGFDSL
jgi:carbamoyl-phosphate synthase large subunit